MKIKKKVDKSKKVGKTKIKKSATESKKKEVDEIEVAIPEQVSVVKVKKNKIKVKKSTATVVDPIISNDAIIKSMERDVAEISDDGKAKDKSKKAENEEKKIVYDKEDEKKTVFCGNVPNDTNASKKRVKDLFAEYGKIKSMRVRSETGSVLFSKKNKNKCNSFNYYIVFHDEEDAKKSLQLNGFMLLDNHLRVNMANRQEFSNKGTVFVGNLSFDATEEEVHKYFSQTGEIDYVRIIPKRGIAYVCFQKGVNLAQALKLNDQEFRGRKLRVSRFESKQKQEKKKLFKRDEKTGRIVKRKVKKAHKIKEDFIKGRQNINNPIIKKIKDSQKAKYNKFTDADQVSKKDIFRRGGKADKNNREINREETKKKQKFSGSKVDDIGSNKKLKKGKISKTAKQQKIIAKKLKSAAVRIHK